MAKKALVFETALETYTAIDVVGNGGAGRVHKVRDASGEVFALKCLLPDRLNAERLKRFKNEITFGQQTRHPNIVRVLDTGAALVDGIKCPFYVMPFYPGTLRTLMSTPAPDRVLTRFAQILDGVEAAHLQKVYHRDLKPENILWDQHSDKLLVADFGIAHFEEEELYTAVETRHASRLANFQYAAPEQRTRGRPVDARADIFALGLILNEMFTGNVLQGAGHKRIGDVASAFRYLDELVESMVQQDPARRIPTIAAIKEELIGRKNAFVALQKLDEARRQVVPATATPAFEPITIVGLGYGDDVLTLKFSRPVPREWAAEFQNPSSAFHYLMNYPPSLFEVRADSASMNMRGAPEKTIQTLVGHAKDYAAAANRAYVQGLEENAQRAAKQQREALEQRVRDAERQKRILENVKL